MSLSGNTEKINELLSKINALPEAGSGGGSGGASMETCTVTLSASSTTYRPYYVSYMTVDNNGNLSAQAVTNSAKTLTLNNVVCGSVVTVYWNNMMVIATTKAVTLLSSGNKYFNAYEITAGNGETAIVENQEGGGST